MEHFFNAAVGTCVAEIITLPCCAIKTNYQNSNSNSIKITTREIYKNYGIRGFYSASAPAILSQIFSSSSKYFVYKIFERNKGMIFPKSLDNRFVYGGVAGFISSIFTHPIDSIKIHMQMKSQFLNKIKNEGLFLFYRGYSKSFSKSVIASSLFIPLYDEFSYNMNNRVLASLLSATISTIIIHPIDYLKTRHIYGLSLYQGFNPLIYYKGLSINLLRVIPHFMITMFIIDILDNKNI